MTSPFGAFKQVFEEWHNRMMARHGESKLSRFAYGEIGAFCIATVFAVVMFYSNLPAINLQAEEFYSYAIMVLAVYTVVRIPALLRRGKVSVAGERVRIAPFLFPVYGIGLLLLILMVGSLLGSPILRSSAYQKLLTVGGGEFTQDVGEVSFDQIPLLDRSSAQKLGDRKLGELADMVSQFEVSTLYTQINLRGRPVRVTPLDYGDFIKWVYNRKEGLPAYLVIDMISQEVEVVRLYDSENGAADVPTGGGMKISMSEPFFRNLRRTLRFQYPTYIFGRIDFEVDEQGIPYWVASRVVKRIGLFGGADVAGIVLLNAITGESEYIQAGEVPTWVDNVFSADLLIRQFDYYGRFQRGYWNAVFGQRDVVMATEGYNYIALRDDVYMYTGVTSVGRDESNTGFILCNMRTKDTRYYRVPGAEEYSAMASAMGIVQHLGYTATFPLLLNIGHQPTYVHALKDAADLVKAYAMVNYSRYNLVATGASIAETERNYLALLRENGLYEGSPILPGTDNAGVPLVEKIGTITEIRSAVVDGTSVYYLRMEESSIWYSVSARVSPWAVLLNAGDEVRLQHLVNASAPLIEVKALYAASFVESSFEGIPAS